jgi:hypothetical protein
MNRIKLSLGGQGLAENWWLLIREIRDYPIAILPEGRLESL